MQKSHLGKLFSASDLVNFAACSHLTHLDIVNLDTPLPKAADSDEMVLIQDKGFEHEGRYLEHLRELHDDVVDLKTDGTDTQAFATPSRSLRANIAITYDLAHPLYLQLDKARHFRATAGERLSANPGDLFFDLWCIKRASQRCGQLGRNRGWDTGGHKHAIPFVGLRIGDTCFGKRGDLGKGGRSA